MDRFKHYRGEWHMPGQRVEASTHAAGDFTFEVPPRFLMVDRDCLLTVDTPGYPEAGSQEPVPQEAVEIQLFKGINPVRVIRIYQAGSDAAARVEGWS